MSITLTSPEILNNQFLKRNICIGLIDGLTIPLAVVAGLSKLVHSNPAIAGVCLAVACAGALTMGIGGYIEAKKYEPARPPVGSALTIAASYFLGGVIVALPYLLISIPDIALRFSIVITLVLLIITGYMESAMNGAKGWQGALRVFVTGVLAAGAAYLVAKLFV